MSAQSPLATRFAHGLDAHWQTQRVGGGGIVRTAAGLRLVKPFARNDRYTNAQIDDYQGRSRGDFLWRPPLRLRVRARFSHPAGVLTGTAGFGFWNDPFMMTPGTRRPTLPRAIWFFYSAPPSNMRLARDVPGWGWKAATLDAQRWPFFLLAPTAPLAVPLMRIGSLYRRLWPIGQRAIHVSEALVEPELTEWHTYVIEWTHTCARFYVDGHCVLDCDTPPRGPLGLVIWIDNQFMVATPWGAFGHGVVASTACEWLEVSCIEVS